MPNKAEFAAAVRQKYPKVYDGISDDDLVSAFIAKYPEYKDQIDDAGLWEKSGRPLWEGPARLGKKIAETQYAEAETPGKYTAPRSRGFFKGVMPPTGSPKQESYEQGAFYEGLGTGFSGLTSPRNLAMGILSKGAQLARGVAGLRGVPSTAANPSQLRTPAARISQAANIGVGAIAAPQVVEGVSQAIYAPEIEEKGLGGLNAVMGLMGMRAGLRGVADIARSRQLMDVLPPAPTFPLPRGQATPDTPYSPIYNGPAGTAPSGVPYRVNTGARTVPSPEGGRIPTEAAIRPVLPTKLEIKRNLDEIVTQIRNFKIEFDHAKEIGDDDTIKELAIKGRALQGQYAELKAEYESAPEIIPPNPYGQATPETVGEVVNLPPQLAAQYGTSLGSPQELPVPHISGVPYDDTYKLWQLLRGLPADPSNATKIGQMIGQYNLTPEDINRIQTGAPETPQPYGEQVNYEEPALNDPSGFILNPHQQPVLNRPEIKPPSNLFKAKQQRDPNDDPNNEIAKWIRNQLPSNINEWRSILGSPSIGPEFLEDSWKQINFAMRKADEYGDRNAFRHLEDYRDILQEEFFNRNMGIPKDEPWIPKNVAEPVNSRRYFDENDELALDRIDPEIARYIEKIERATTHQKQVEIIEGMRGAINWANSKGKSHFAEQLQKMIDAAPAFWQGSAPIEDIDRRPFGSTLSTNVGRWSNSDSPVVRDLANRANEFIDRPLTQGEGDQEIWTPERQHWLEDIRNEIHLAEMQGDEYRRGELKELYKAVTNTWERNYDGDIQLDEPQFARVGKNTGKIGQNIERSAKELTTGYNAPLAAIMVREGLQNAIDAAKKVPNGEIEITITREGIEIADNGPGMSRHNFFTVMSNLHESGKVGDESASGGKGVGKAVYMLGGKHFTITSVKNLRGRKYSFTMQGTPQQLMKKFEVDWTEVDPNTPTGTRFKTVFDEGQDQYDARWMLDKIIQYSRDVNLKLKHKKNYPLSYEDPFDNITIKSRVDDTQIADEVLFNGSNKVEVLVPKNVNFGEQSYISVYYLNKGMYQFNDSFSIGEKTNGMPEEIIVDITPLVEEGDTKYPFGTSRETIKDDLSKEIDELIKERVVKPFANRKKKDLAKLWTQMPITGKIAGRDVVFFDPGDRLTIQEKEEFQTNPIFTQLISEIGTVVSDILASSRDTTWINKVERVGITLDPNMHGVHIPNPSSSRDNPKSAILINPFPSIDLLNPIHAATSIVVTALHETAHVGTVEPTDLKLMRASDLDDPRVGRYLATFLKELNEQGRGDFSHGVNFIKRLGNLYATYGTKKAFDAIYRIESLLSTEPGRYSSEVQRLLQIYSESRGRDATTEDILSGTGVKSEIAKGGKGNDVGNTEGFGGGTIRVDSRRSGTPVGRLAQALHAAKRLAPEQRELYAEERNRRIRKAARTGGTGRKWATGYLRAQQGQLPKVEFEALKLNEADVDALFTMIKKSKNLSPFEKNGAITGLIKVLGEGGGYLPQENEINKIARALGDSSNSADIDALVSALTSKKSLGAKAGDVLVNNVVGATKTAMASFDMSAALRQALPSIHRKEWWSTFPTLWRAWGGHKGKNGQAIYDGIMLSIRENPYYDLATEAGIAFTDMNARGITGREEHMVGSWLERIPSPTHMVTGRGNELSLYSRGIKGSNRSYTAFLNKLRMDVFASIMTDYEKSGLADKKTRMLFARQTAEYVNNTTGRGSLGKLEPAAKLMNVIFFSPRNMASRVNLLKKVFEPSFYTTLDPRVRNEYLKSMFAWIAAGSVLVELSKLIGAEVSNDPTSPDFRKAKINKTRFDPYGGFQQYVVLVSTLMSGNRTSSTTGRSYQLGKGYGVNTRKDITENFFVNKLSPEIRFAYMMWDAHTNSRGQMLDQMGQPMNPYAEQAKLYIPLVAQDIYQVAQEDPLVASILAIPMFFGASVQEYAK